MGARDPRDELEGQETVVAHLRAEEGRVDLDLPDLAFLLHASVVDVVRAGDARGDDDGAAAMEGEGIGRCATGLVTTGLRHGDVHGGPLAGCWRWWGAFVEGDESGCPP